MADYIDWFSYVEPALHTYNKSHLVVVCDFFFLYVAGFYLLIFCSGLLHLSTWEKSIWRGFFPRLFFFLFFVMSLSDFHTRVILPHKMSWEVFPPLTWKRLCKIRANSSNFWYSSVVKLSGLSFGGILFVGALNYEFSFFNGYRIILIIYFILIEFS